MKLIVALYLIFVIAVISTAQADDGRGTVIKSDERVVFFVTDASLSDDGTTWRVPIHVWVHELENAGLRRHAVAAILKKQHGLQRTADNKSTFDRRVRLIAADNERDKNITVDLVGEKWDLNPTQPNGHSYTVFTLDATRVNQHAINGQLQVKAILPVKDVRSFKGVVNLVAPAGLSVISDFDDTIKITEVTDTAKMLENSLFKQFQAVEGMATLYKRWSKLGAAFHIVSSSPWQLSEPIDAFLKNNGFPNSSLSLKYFRFKDASVFNLLKLGIETKPEQINAVLSAYPERTFVLVGDSGEQDPEVYTRLFRENPTRIRKIYIRNITNAHRTDQRMSNVFEGIDPDVWELFDEPGALTLPEQ